MLNLNSKIENILFDLGNVIINIDAELTKKAFINLGFTNFSDFYTLFSQVDVFNKFDTGKCEPSDFRDAIRRISPVALTDAQIDKAWCAMLLNFPDENIALLKNLRKRYKLYLLSNTNKIHIDYYYQYLQKEKGDPLIPSLFDQVFYSHEIGYRKPDAAAFEYVLKAANISAENTLFIDDLLPNVEAARKVGLEAYHLAGGEKLYVALERR
ncbi:hydrolase [Bacteroidia bacterium]|nr:hydrolase [Bacteroidia bacterium]